MLTNLDPQALDQAQTCPAVGYQTASVCVPVTVTPFAQTGITVTRCCGTPVVTPGLNVCPGVKNGASFPPGPGQALPLEYFMNFGETPFT